MPITLSYDLSNASSNQRNYIRSALERFGWYRLGGSVLRYPAPGRDEDWLNEVAPSLFFVRSFAIRNGITFTYLTIDAQSVVFVDHSDPQQTLGQQPLTGPALVLAPPTNPQSNEAAIRDFVTRAHATWNPTA